jgi:hypothetical protein
MPGYLGYLAVIYSLAGAGRNAVSVVQVFIDPETAFEEIRSPATLRNTAFPPTGH